MFDSCRLHFFRLVVRILLRAITSSISSFITYSRPVFNAYSLMQKFANAMVLADLGVDGVGSY